MKMMLLAAVGLSAAVALPAPPARADNDGPRLVNRAPVTVHRGVPDGRHRFDRRHRGFDGIVYLPDREYQGDTLWQPESFNDWWHERPERSYPRWLMHNQDCQRQWWSGGGWRC